MSLKNNIICKVEVHTSLLKASTDKRDIDWEESKRGPKMNTSYQCLMLQRTKLLMDSKRNDSVKVVRTA